MIEVDSADRGVDTGMSCRFLTPESPEWEETLERIPHDYYHLPAYISFASRFNNLSGMVCAFAATQDQCYFFAPLIIRPIASPPAGRDGPQLFDATGLPGDPGLIAGCARSPSSAAFLNGALDAFLAGLRENSVVSCFLWLHPLWLPEEKLLRRLGHLRHHKLSVSIDLTLPSETLWQQMRSNHRRAITRAVHDGQMARIDSTWETFGAFVEMYQETMRRVGAKDYWYLSPKYFEGLKDALSDRLHLCVVEQNGELVCAGLFSEVAGVVQYIYGASCTHALRYSPAKTMIHFMTLWAKGRGNHTLHLGGGVNSEDDLFHFKVGFSARMHPVMSWRIIVDAPAYRRLTVAWETREGVTADGSDGFFPAYRKPSLR
jgi:Acetyltransferase (GNAT) domain